MYFQEYKYNIEEGDNNSELDINYKLKQHMSNLKLLHNQLENSLISMIKSLSKVLVSPKSLITSKSNNYSII